MKIKFGNWFEFEVTGIGMFLKLGAWEVWVEPVRESGERAFGFARLEENEWVGTLWGLEITVSRGSMGSGAVLAD